MRKILNSRLFRLLVCLILVCCLLVNSSSIKAAASVQLTAWGWVAAAVGVAAIFQALGVMAGSDATAFNTAVNDCVTWLTESTSFVVNGMVNVMGLMSGSVTSSFFAKDMIQSIWEWISDSGTVSPLVDTVPANSTYVFHEGSEYTVTGECVVFRVNYIDADNYNYHRYYEALVKTSSSGAIRTAAGNSVSSSFSLNDCSYTYATKDQSRYASNYPSLTAGSVYLGTLNQGTSTLNLKYALSTLMTNYLAGEYDSSYRADGLTLGQIELPTVGTDEEIISIEIAPIYVDWATGEVSATPPDTGEGKKEYLPVGVPSTELDDLLISQTQEQAQSGETNLEFDFETSTGDGTGDSTGDGSGDTSTDTGGSSGSWTPPSDVTQFRLVDLKNYFPFCIPFDLFEFFKLLYAEPVAPVLYWEIQDLAGQTYSLSIDLSEWDSVAQLFRRLQLFLFVCGLAAASRKFIKW